MFSVESLLGRENGEPRQGGPVGKARLIFEEVSRLACHKEQPILGIVEVLLTARRITR